MKHIQEIVPIVICVAGGLLSSTASRAQDATSACGSVTDMERRIVERADQGVENLRSFVWFRRDISGIDMQMVKQSLDSWRATVACQKAAAGR